MNYKEIELLIEKYLSGKASDEEKQQLERWYESIDKTPETQFLEGRLTNIRAELYHGIFKDSKIDEHGRPVSGSIVRSLYRYIGWVAAVLVLCAGAGYYLLNSNFGSEKDPVQFNALNNDVAPGGSRALLTLADGSVIQLENALRGNLASQGAVLVKKTEEGQLVYEIGAAGMRDTLLSNTISTPRGGEFSLTLTDGTKVWLNSDSKLTFPAVFRGKERTVEVTGEAYFEVAKNVNMPFRVMSEGQTVEVLGTHFNVNAYPEEPYVRTTLLEGRVNVKAGSRNKLLLPGQQALVPGKGSETDKMLVQNGVNLEEVVAWKNQLFQFENSDIRTIMGQIERWYDVDVIYLGRLPDEHYTGKVSRNVNLSQALKILRTSGINFKIEGRKIYVE